MSPSSWHIEVGDCRDVLRSMPAQSVHTVVTSPPFFGLRDYGTGRWEGGDPACEHKNTNARQDHSLETMLGTRGVQGASAAAATPMRAVCSRCSARRVDRQIGLEPTPDEFVAALVEVFREVRRVLRDDGCVWINLGDSYAGSYGNQGRKVERGSQRPINGDMLTPVHDGRYPTGGSGTGAIPPGADYKAKDLLGIPWMVAFALRADGWYLRSDIVWSKPNPMPESVTDRPTKSHEYLFLLSKSAKYHYDADAIREGLADDEREHAPVDGTPALAVHRNGSSRGGYLRPEAGRRNKRSVWTVATQPYANAHFATYPPKLIEPCILAGAPERACGECGAPWVRVVERGDYDNGDGSPGERGLGDARSLSRDETGRVDGFTKPPRNAARQVTTLGFEPSCSHGDGSAAGVVLDPFAGAGTTGIVALQHRRDFVGIELNPGYAAMARTRIETAVRLGFRSPQNGPVQILGQASIFDLDGAA